MEYIAKLRNTFLERPILRSSIEHQKRIISAKIKTPKITKLEDYENFIPSYRVRS